ncbi:MAG: DUF2330 domain-containing protein [Planctomycetes bacterium]|jgi:hypothetical protein|nr:DUF2330 domain-containing protein [Phycisphaerae bacterium]NBB96102.1 DUF2330 domain-containing protein [Planctomycetota bacterium]
MTRTARATAAALVCLAIFASTPALADGCAFVPIGSVAHDNQKSSVTSPRQECLMVADGRTVRMVLRTHFETPSPEMAWVVPIPAKPRDIKKADGELFAALDQATAPTFYTVESSKGPFGCGCNSMAMRRKGLGTWRNAVTVHEQGTAGIYEFVVLSSTGGDELTTWLNENGYALPIGAERVLGRYVEKGWYWLAMRLRKDLSDADKDDDGKLVPHPIAYTYDSETLTFPLVISQISAGLENEILLYVLAPFRYAVANWPNLSVDQLIYRDAQARKFYDEFKRANNTPSGTTYEYYFKTATNSRDGRIFITESALPVNEGGFGHFDAETFREMLDTITAALPDETKPAYLTRLRTVMPPTTMDHDVVLVPVQWRHIDNYIQMSAADTGLRSETAMAGVGMGLLMLGTWPRRRKLPRTLRVVLCLLACTVLCAL